MPQHQKRKMAGTSPAIAKQCCQYLNMFANDRLFVSVSSSRAPLDPRHHGARPGADVFDRMRGA
jgi:hypothetical protein